MPCRNAGPFLREAVESVLQQPECLELLVADGGSSDGSLTWLEQQAATNPRLRLVSRSDAGPADALNRAFQIARGSLIGWLNADDIYPPGALARAVAALEAHPEWLMAYGEGEEFNAATGLRQRYPTLLPSVGLQGFRFHCFICQPTVVFRRTLATLLGPFDAQWHTAFDMDYWLRAFASFPHRIGFIPHLQGRTRLHEATITSRQRRQAALETTALTARHCGSATAIRLHNYALDLVAGRAELPKGENLSQHLTALADATAAWVGPEELAQFRYLWLLDPDTARALQAAEKEATARQLTTRLPVRLLQALHQELQLNAEGSPAGPHRRLWQAIQTSSGTYPLLKHVQEEQAAATGTRAIQPFLTRPFGVNLIGHAQNLGGNGEDMRMAARALQAAGVPCCVINHPALQASAGLDHSLDPLLCNHAAGGPYAFNLVCLSAQIQARWQLQAGVEPLRERYTLAAWPWETSRWPEAWLPLLELVDELWPASHFTAEALREPAAAAQLPLQLIPMAAEILDPERFRSPASRQATRARHNLPPDALLFAAAFDFNSTAIRKNPMAALEAFQQAFPPADAGPDVALVIKTFPPQGVHPEWHWLQLRAAEDPRIHLVVASLERDELLALYGCCGVFVSLHRSEGFGRNLAEALQLGLHVIASDVGGNTDFCTGPLAHPVPCREVPIPRGAYPCADGHVWGEPDLDHAAALMRQLAAKGVVSPNPLLAQEYRERFSCAAAGARYRARLEALWSQREALAGRLRWRAHTPI